MDPETMYDDVANVGIKDGRIAVITKGEIQGKETINAKGLVVAPGFIDTHFHSVDPFAAKMVVADGVTTGMDLEAGATRADRAQPHTGDIAFVSTKPQQLFVRHLIPNPHQAILAPGDEPLPVTVDAPRVATSVERRSPACRRF